MKNWICLFDLFQNQKFQPLFQNHISLYSKHHINIHLLQTAYGNAPRNISQLQFIRFSYSLKILKIMRTRRSGAVGHIELESQKKRPSQKIQVKLRRSIRLVQKSDSAQQKQVSPIKKLNFARTNSKKQYRSKKSEQRTTQKQKKIIRDKSLKKNIRSKAKLSASQPIHLQGSSGTEEKGPKNGNAQHQLPDSQSLKSAIIKKTKALIVQSQGQVFVHNYISSTTPIATQILFKFTQIHSHTQINSRSLNLCESAQFIKYRLSFTLAQNPSSKSNKNRSKKSHSKNSANKIVKISLKVEFKYLDRDDVDLLKKMMVDSKKMTYHEYQEMLQKIGSSVCGHVFFSDHCKRRIFTVQNVPEFIHRKYDQEGPFQKVRRFYEFLKESRSRIIVGTHKHDGRTICTYLKVQEGSQNVYVPLDYSGDVTVKLPLQSSSEHTFIGKPLKIGFAQFNENLPKRIFERMRSTQFLRAQLYPSWVTLQPPKRHNHSLIGNSISTRHSINVCEMLKYIKTINAKLVELDRGSQTFLYSLPSQLTFKGIIKLKMTNLESLDPLQFVELDSLEILELQGKCTYNLRSLRKLSHRNPLKEIKIVNEQLFLSRVLMNLRGQNTSSSKSYSFANLNYLTQLNFSPEFQYSNHYDGIAPLQLLAKIGYQEIFLSQDEEMMTKDIYYIRYIQSNGFELANLFHLGHHVAQLRMLLAVNQGEQREDRANFEANDIRLF